jgi:hypothetical protein
VDFDFAQITGQSTSYHKYIEYVKILSINYGFKELISKQIIVNDISM